MMEGSGRQSKQPSSFRAETRIDKGSLFDHELHSARSFLRRLRGCDDLALERPRSQPICSGGRQEHGEARQTRRDHALFGFRTHGHDRVGQGLPAVRGHPWNGEEGYQDLHPEQRAGD